MGTATIKVKGGKLLRVRAEAEEGRIRSVRITGDFFAYPEEVIEKLESELTGAEVSRESIRDKVERVIAEVGATLIGVSAEDVVECVYRAVTE